MSCLSRTVNRVSGEAVEDGDIPNKWKWEWVSREVKVGESKQRIGDHFRKVDSEGRMARCITCNKELSYAKRGITALVDHVNGKKHIDAMNANKGNTTIPGGF